MTGKWSQMRFMLSSGVEEYMVFFAYIGFNFGGPDFRKPNVGEFFGLRAKSSNVVIYNH